MSGFDKTSLDVRTSDGRNVVLLEPLTFTRPQEVGGQVITMPAGATSDGASIPKVFWSLGLAPFGPYWLATVLHDGLYRGLTSPRIDDRDVADLILWEAMTSLGVAKHIAQEIYEGVHLGGQVAWDKDRAQLTDEGRRHDVAG